MTYALKTLEKEIKLLERNVREKDMMRQNMNDASLEFKKIAEIKKAIKKLKAQSR